MVTKICVGNYIGDIYRHAKFYPNRFRGFRSAHARFRAPRHKVTRLLFLGGGFLRKAIAETRAPILSKIRQTTRFRARKCLLGVAKPRSKVSTPIFPKNRHAQKLIRLLTQGRALFSQITLITFIVEPPMVHSE